uniref:Uncharacterized protein n=1 Tax=Setaria viridis TaxID=4556 RepID=A0A4V6D303_SETVI|nr:hypothetical protein SEVIR_8G125866v2 [Setaria viridis]
MYHLKFSTLSALLNLIQWTCSCRVTSPGTLRGQHLPSPLISL